jgi:2-isopropylmalate synthase
MLKMGHEVLPAENLKRLCEVSRYAYDLANMNYRNGQPFVGQSAFAHKGGMHVHAVARIPASYEHINPAAVGNERRVLMSELAGQSNVMVLVGHHELTRDQAKKVLNRVQDLENEGYQFEAADASFDLLVRREIGIFRPYFHALSTHVHTAIAPRDPGDTTTALAENAAPSSSNGRDTWGMEHETTNEATVKLQIKYPSHLAGQIQHTVGEGDGPVNALDSALRKALEPVFPKLKGMRLVDYKVRVVNPRAGTAARVRVTIESADEEKVWGTVGVHENIIQASWQALVDSFQYKLMCDDEPSK